MPPLLIILLGLIAIVIVVSLVWRVASQRESLPCPAWLSWMVELDNPILRNNRACEIISHLDLRPGMTVLDFGCGPGRVAVPAAKAVGPSGSVTALDIQPAMLERVRAKAAQEDLENIVLVQAAAGKGKLGRDQYDRALLVTVLGEIPDKQILLKEIFASLKPGGLLAITEAIADPHFQTRETVREAVQAAGFHEKGFYGNRIAYTMILEKP